mmetsp:Transcript_6168/g.11703  ORF Transcript_6168/g.11703 Transcript_6168/m.11703 type:complete len:163 (-) Transcript_6168:228-716(-)
MVLAQSLQSTPEEEEAEEAAEVVERWYFRTAAPALPLTSYGSGLGLEANALECWEIQRSCGTGGGSGGGANTAADNNLNDDSTITRAVVNIENETGRLLLVFRETIVMEQTPDGTGTEVTKTLNLDGVPSVACGAFVRRWKMESEVIFHALLGTCDRKKMKG